MYSFFASYVTPYKPFTSKTIALWVLETLGKAGIGTNTFMAYAMHYLSTSDN